MRSFGVLESSVGAEAQGERQGLLALTHLVAAIDVEQGDLLQEFTGPLHESGLHVCGSHRLVDDEGHVLLGQRE